MYGRIPKFTCFGGTCCHETSGKDECGKDLKLVRYQLQRWQRFKRYRHIAPRPGYPHLVGSLGDNCLERDGSTMSYIVPASITQPRIRRKRHRLERSTMAAHLVSPLQRLLQPPTFSGLEPYVMLKMESTVVSELRRWGD